MDGLKLIYINRIGSNWKGENLFEFLFSNKTNWDWDESWYESSVITSREELLPDMNFIKSVGSLKTNDLDLSLVQEINIFEIYNAVEGIVALGWQKFNEDEDEVDYDQTRLVFKFGESKELVEDKLYSLDLKLDYEKKYSNE